MVQLSPLSPLPSPLSHPVTRADALALVHEYTASDSLRKHMLAVEEAMRAYAARFGEDVGEDSQASCDFD